MIHIHFLIFTAAATKTFKSRCNLARCRTKNRLNICSSYLVQSAHKETCSHLGQSALAWECVQPTEWSKSTAIFWMHVHACESLIFISPTSTGCLQCNVCQSQNDCSKKLVVDYFLFFTGDSEVQGFGSLIYHNMMSELERDYIRNWNNYMISLSKTKLNMFQTHSKSDSWNQLVGHLVQKMNYGSHSLPWFICWPRCPNNQFQISQISDRNQFRANLEQSF
jgi:hypothetical protein